MEKQSCHEGGVLLWEEILGRFSIKSEADLLDAFRVASVEEAADLLLEHFVKVRILLGRWKFISNDEGGAASYNDGPCYGSRALSFSDPSDVLSDEYESPIYKFLLKENFEHATDLALAVNCLGILTKEELVLFLEKVKDCNADVHRRRRRLGRQHTSSSASLPSPPTSPSVCSVELTTKQSDSAAISSTFHRNWGIEDEQGMSECWVGIQDIKEIWFDMLMRQGDFATPDTYSQKERQTPKEGLEASRPPLIFSEAVATEFENRLSQALLLLMKNVHQTCMYRILSAWPVRSYSDRKVLCRVYGLMDLPKWVFTSVIDTPEMARLREVKQLGACSRIYPSATHTRFEHSLGVGYSAGVFWDKLIHTTTGSPHDRETMRLRNCLTMAGLCHDLGHGPYSHTFEVSFLKKLENPIARAWHHEDMSMKLFDRIHQIHCPNLPDEDARMIKDMIAGRVPNHSAKSYCDDSIESLTSAAYQIISNSYNGIDVDRMDYLRRDSSIGENLRSFTSERIIDYARIIGGRICFREKERDSVFKLFETRYRMFQSVYTHRKVAAFEFMMCDALNLVDSILKISDCLEDCERFLLLNDSILQKVMWLDPTKYDGDDADNIRSAQHLLRRIDSRDTYQFAGEVQLSGLLSHTALEEKFDARHLLACAPIPAYGRGVTSPLTEKDIIPDWHRIDYGSGNLNPMENVYFFDPAKPHETLKQKPPYVADWQSTFLRVYSRRQEHADTLRLAFDQWCRQNLQEGHRQAYVPGGPRNVALSPTGLPSQTLSPAARRLRSLSKTTSTEFPPFPT